MQKSGEENVENNSLGGVSIFRDIDLPETFLRESYHKEPTFAELERWFSPARMSSYRNSTTPAALYLWNTHLSKAFLEDIEHVEVLLRNFIAERLTADYGSPFWFDARERYHFNEPFMRSVKKARKRLADKGGKNPTADAIIAELSFDNWRFLLSPRHEVTIWRVLIKPANGGMPNYPGHKRDDFEADAEKILQLRNRASHQKSFINQAEPIDQEQERLYKYWQAILRTAARIDPDAAMWISRHSRVVTILQERPLELQPEE